METTFDDGFNEYRDRMNKLANAQDAESYHLNEMAKHLNDLSANLVTMADSLNQAVNDCNDFKGGLGDSAAYN
jgi:ABC-type transporter Mla subunit MlaD